MSIFSATPIERRHRTAFRTLAAKMRFDPFVGPIPAPDLDGNKSQLNLWQDLYRSHSDRGGIIAYANHPSGKRIGAGLLMFRRKENPPAIFINETFVLPEFQRQGVFGLMLQEICQMAAESNCNRVYAYTDPANQVARAAFKQFGRAHETNIPRPMVVYDFPVRPSATAQVLSRVNRDTSAPGAGPGGE